MESRCYGCRDGVRMKVGALLLVLAGLGPLPFPRYVARVHTVRLSLDRVAAHPSLAGIQAAQTGLRGLPTVRLPDGRVVTTGLPALAATLTPQTAPAVARQMDALDRVLRAAHPSSVSGSELAALDSILRDPRFQTGCTPVECVSVWFLDLLNRLLAGTGGGNLPFDVRPVLALGFLALLAAVLLLVVRAVRRRLVPSVERQPTRQVEGSAEARARAEAAEAAGRYRDAMHWLFLATLLALQESGELRFRPGLTNQELVREAGNVPALRPLADRFDAVWYGHLPFGAAEYAAFREMVGGVAPRAA